MRNIASKQVKCDENKRTTLNKAFETLNEYCESGTYPIHSISTPHHNCRKYIPYKRQTENRLKDSRISYKKSKKEIEGSHVDILCICSNNFHWSEKWKKLATRYTISKT